MMDSRVLAVNCQAVYRAASQETAPGSKEKNVCILSATILVCSIGRAMHKRSVFERGVAYLRVLS